MPNTFAEPFTSPVKASSFRVKTFIKAQKLYTLQFHCQWECFQNFSCKIYVADAEKETLCFSLNQTVPELMKIGLQRQHLLKLGTPRFFPAPVSLAFTDLNNFFWPRRDLGETTLTHLLWANEKPCSADGGRGAWRILVSTPGPWPPDHSSLPHLFW